MDYHYPRAAYADEIAGIAMGAGIRSRPTIFLAAPRRTGKSTFLMEELTPALERKGATVLYVDLWKSRSQDPAELIAYTVANALAASQGFIARAAQAAGLSKVSIHGVEFSLDDVGKQAGASISDALSELHLKVGRPIVFIIDEAQHAIQSTAGMDAMFALKSARDVLNRPGKVNLALVMSGSDRDKLLRLVHGNGTPFTGSGITEFKSLDRGFTAFLSGLLVAELPKLIIDNERLFQAFERFGHKPEEILRGIGAAVEQLKEVPANLFNDLLDEEADRYEAEQYATFQTAYEGLTKLQRAVLTRILAHGRSGKLFDADALDVYTKAHGRKVLAGSARTAVEKLREMDPPLIWKSARGDYAPEDGAMRTWYERLVAKGAWPPTS